MKFPLLSIDGSKSSPIEISDKLVKLKVNHKLIKFVIDWQLNHAKPRTAKTKQRNEIKGSTKKIVPQKSKQIIRNKIKNLNKEDFKYPELVHAEKQIIFKKFFQEDTYNLEKFLKIKTIVLNLINILT